MQPHVERTTHAVLSVGNQSPVQERATQPEAKEKRAPKTVMMWPEAAAEHPTSHHRQTSSDKVATLASQVLQLRIQTWLAKQTVAPVMRYLWRVNEREVNQQ